MLEIVMAGKPYSFNFGIGFLRAIDATIQADVPDTKGVKKAIGFRYHFSSVLDGDVQSFETILYHANSGQNPRVTMAVLDSWIDDPETDLDKTMKEVQDFLLESNACKKLAKTIIKRIEEATEKQA